MDLYRLLISDGDSCDSSCDVSLSSCAILPVTPFILLLGNHENGCTWLYKQMQVENAVRQRQVQEIQKEAELQQCSVLVWISWTHVIAAGCIVLSNDSSIITLKVNNTMFIISTHYSICSILSWRKAFSVLLDWKWNYIKIRKKIKL